MYLKTLPFFLFFFSLQILGKCQDSTVIYSLQKCVEIAIKNNLDVNNAKFQMESADVNLQSAKASRLPVLSGNVSHDIYNGRSINIFTNTYTNQQYLSASYGLSGSLTIWSGSSIQNYLHKAAIDSKLSEMKLQQAKDNLTLNILLLYLAVLSNQEQLNIIEKQVENTQKKVDLLELKNKRGAITPSDFYDMKGQLAADKLSLASIKNTLENSKLTLTQTMNIPYSPDIKLEKTIRDITGTQYTSTVNEIYQHAAQNLAAIKSEQLSKQSTYMAVEAAKGKMLPTLNLVGGIYTNYSSTATTLNLQNTSDVLTPAYVLLNNVKTPVYTPESVYQSENIQYFNQLKNNFSSAIGINLTIPILNGLQAKNNIKLAKINDRQADYKLGIAKNQLRQAIEQDFINMSTSLETYNILSEQVQAYAQSFKLAELKFSAGSISIVDYIIAKNNLDRTNINLSAARFDYIFKTKILDFYLGIPIW